MTHSFTAAAAVICWIYIKMTPKYNEIHQAICEMQTPATTMKKVGANQL